MKLSPRNASAIRWRQGAVAAVVAGLVAGCGGGQEATAPPGPREEASEPLWTRWGGTAVPSGPPERSDAAAADAPAGAVDPLPLPGSCASSGLTDAMEDAAERLTDPEFTEVRAEGRLECSWAGYAPREGSQVVLVTFLPERSEVEYPGHVPESARGNPDYFTTPELEALGGLAVVTGGEMFSGVDVHLPGMLMSVTAHRDLDEDELLLEAATETASRLFEAGSTER
ncbi:hypothetical protein HNR23_000420 [Nocardiopsis mwathae]|uniref:Uncharacterized protein n=1 Tax=Nocardiopsis mwathae TaxID=1472723 RepID=A0A7X0D3T6_9ACTN|nr:hypothetical protein [Nocardiopsis mwathae]MBB6170360.1 hypothetical protein [Nocardiopsis mwathae]